MRALLWRLSMRYIVWAYVHLLPQRRHPVATPGGDGWIDGLGFNICPERDRWTLHTLAAAPPDHEGGADYTFWVRELPNGNFRATEVESGVSAAGPTAQGALQCYWEGKYE